MRAFTHMGANICIAQGHHACVSAFHLWLHAQSQSHTGKSSSSLTRTTSPFSYCPLSRHPNAQGLGAPFQSRPWTMRAGHTKTASGITLQLGNRVPLRLVTCKRITQTARVKRTGEKTQYPFRKPLRQGSPPVRPSRWTGSGWKSRHRHGVYLTTRGEEREGIGTSVHQKLWFPEKPVKFVLLSRARYQTPRKTTRTYRSFLFLATKF